MHFETCVQLLKLKFDSEFISNLQKTVFDVKILTNLIFEL